MLRRRVRTTGLLLIAFEWRTGPQCRLLAPLEVGSWMSRGQRMRRGSALARPVCHVVGPSELSPLARS